MDVSSKYLLVTQDSMDGKDILRLVDDKAFIDNNHHSLEIRHTVACLCVFYRLHFRECKQELHQLISPYPFYQRYTRRTAGIDDPYLADI